MYLKDMIKRGPSKAALVENPSLIFQADTGISEKGVVDLAIDRD